MFRFRLLVSVKLDDVTNATVGCVLYNDVFSQSYFLFILRQTETFSSWKIIL